MNRLIITSFVLALFTLSCDKIDDPFLNTNGGAGATANEEPRNILIEDYTGHTCGNCPDAAVKAEAIKATYGDQIKIVAIHVGTFARPKFGSKFNSDYRTDAGDAYDQEFGPNLALPTGAINRLPADDGKLVHNRGNWATFVAEHIDDVPLLKMEIASNYNETSRNLSVDVTATTLDEGSSSYNVVLYLVEDKITDWQKNYSDGDPSYAVGDIENYTHKHVLRDNINGTWGTAIFNSGFGSGEEKTESFTYNSMNSEWNDSECSVIAYIYDTETYEILQVEEVKIK